MSRQILQYLLDIALTDEGWSSLVYTRPAWSGQDTVQQCTSANQSRGYDLVANLMSLSWVGIL